MLDQPVITLETFEEHYRQRAIRTDDLTGAIRLVDSQSGCATERGRLRRWVPVRPLVEISSATIMGRLKAAWGVLTGRYDALHWKLDDEDKGQ